MLDRLVEALQAGECGMATLMAKNYDISLLSESHIVKVVSDARGRALLFTRAPVPCGTKDYFHQHIGIYAYRRDLLLGYGRLPASRLEAVEKLEQLRALESGDSHRDGRDRKADLERRHARRYNRHRASIAERGSMSKFIFVTGGVLSGLGKGIAAASIGRLLESHGYKITLQKFDPYLNVDPGTMSPFQHGEVYVTDDGAETDLDLGHYERFTSTRTTKYHNWTAGKIYDPIIRKERRGEYLGQDRPGHPPRHRRDQGRLPGGPKRQRHRHRRDRRHGRRHREPAVPRSLPADAAQPRPVRSALRPPDPRPLHRGLGRAQDQADPAHGQRAAGDRDPARHPPLPDGPAPEPDIKSKIALFTNVPTEAVITAKDVSNVYEIPLLFAREGLDTILLKQLRLDARTTNLEQWKSLVSRIKHPRGEVDIALVGKYAGLKDSYISLKQALDHGGLANRLKVNIHWIEAEDLETGRLEKTLGAMDGILVPGGFGHRGIEGKIRAVTFARENKVPFFGICLGMQCAAIEFARNVAGLAGANSSEFDDDTPAQDLLQVARAPRHPAISAGRCAWASTSAAWSGTRSPSRPTASARSTSGTAIATSSTPNTSEPLAEAGLFISGKNPDYGLVELIEMKGHPWFLGCQFHPEFKSKPLKPHPLFKAFIGASHAHRHQRRRKVSPGVTARGGRAGSS